MGRKNIEVLGGGCGGHVSCILGVDGKLGFGFTVHEKWEEGVYFKNPFFMITNFSPRKVGNGPFKFSQLCDRFHSDFYRKGY